MYRTKGKRDSPKRELSQLTAVQDLADDVGNLTEPIDRRDFPLLGARCGRNYMSTKPSPATKPTVVHNITI
jgi:hypothetical protein